MRLSDYDETVKAAYEAYLAARFKSEVERERLRTVYFERLTECEDRTAAKEQ